MNRTGMSEYKIGVIYTALSYIAWGVLPLYWKQIDHIPAMEILAHRVVWSFAFVLGIVFLTKKSSMLVDSVKSLLKNRVSLLWVIASSILVSINWVTYIWAVNSEHIIEASLGYYINPLISVLLGIVVLKERLLFWQAISFIIAAIGVLILTIQYGSFPWVAFTLAISFGFYGLTKKLTKLDSLIGLTLETMVVTPIALLYLLFLYRGGVDAFSGASFDIKFILMGAGVATAIPLLWFASGAKRIPLSMVAILQYFSPTISLILGVFLYHEHFSKIHMITFICIWLALLIYSLSNTKLLTSIQPKFHKDKSLGA